MTTANEEVELEAGVVLTTEDETNGAAPPEKTDEEKHYEERARRMGWRPKEEYNGRGTWVDAKTFVERGEHELPIIRERFRKLDERLVNTEKKLNEADKRSQEQLEVLMELRQMSKTAHETGYKRAMEDIRSREIKAVKEADTESWEAIQREKEAIEAGRTVTPPVRTEPEKKVDEPATPNPVIQEWIRDNSWFRTDQILNVYALNMDAEIERETPGWPMDEKLAEVKRRVMDKFPEKFGRPEKKAEPERRSSVAAVSVSAGAIQRQKGKTVKDLPPDAREALAKIKRQIPNYKDEEYLKLYFKEEE